MKPIYLDYNATTPSDPAVLAAMLPYLGFPDESVWEHNFGNPSSTHLLGKTAHDAVDQARRQVADFLGAQPDEIIFTSGGTEASNHAIKGSAFQRVGQRLLDAGISGLFKRSIAAHIVISAIEHPATSDPCAFLRRLGCKITIVPVDRYGLVDPDDVRKAIARPTTLVSIMHANNEVGTIQPIREIVRLAHERGILVHTDAAQSLGKVSVNVDEW